ncbi:unnamed protein product [Ophioblennius macclurei]
MEMIIFYMTLLSLTTMTVTSGSSGSSCDEDCADKPVFNPPRLVVEYGTAASVRCTACQQACQHDQIGMNISVGQVKKDGNLMLWKIDELLEWDVSATCYYTDDNDNLCCSHLPVTVYQPPSHIFLNMVEVIEGIHYQVDCTVLDVAPLKNVVVTFYKKLNGSVQVFGEQKFTGWSSRTPASQTFTVEAPQIEDDDSMYWCEAKLDLGPEVSPLAMTSRKVKRSLPETTSSGNELNLSLTLCFALLLFSLIDFI